MSKPSLQVKREREFSQAAYNRADQLQGIARKFSQTAPELAKFWDDLSQTWYIIAENRDNLAQQLRKEEKTKTGESDKLSKEKLEVYTIGS